MLFLIFVNFILNYILIINEYIYVYIFIYLLSYQQYLFKINCLILTDTYIAIQLLNILPFLVHPQLKLTLQSLLCNQDVHVAKSNKRDIPQICKLTETLRTLLKDGAEPQLIYNPFSFLLFQLGIQMQCWRWSIHVMTIGTKPR